MLITCPVLIPFAFHSSENSCKLAKLPLGIREDFWCVGTALLSFALVSIWSELISSDPPHQEGLVTDIP